MARFVENYSAGTLFAAGPSNSLLPANALARVAPKRSGGNSPTTSCCRSGNGSPVMKP